MICFEPVVLLYSKIVILYYYIKLENYKKERFEVKGNYWELSDGIFDRINDENRQSYVDFMIKNPFIAKRKFVNVNAQ